MEELIDIERSIIKKYRKPIWAKFIKAIKEFDLIKENDVIAVCISGGKDSFLLAKCMQELLRHGKIKFDIKFLIMNPGYNKENYELIIRNCKKLNINPHTFDNSIFDITEKVKGSPCYLCARMRRGFLYSKAKELGCNKIALGHHFDDVIETIMLNMIFNGQYSSMMPKLHSDNFEAMELIRPLYFVREKDIISFSKSNNLKFLDCACKLTKRKEESNRYKIKKIIENLDEFYENTSYNIYKSSTNVNLNTIIEYKKDNDIFNFLDEYENKNK